MIKAFIGIGSNIGDVHHNCIDAVRRIGLISGCEVSRLSNFFLTEPVGVEGQDWYLNAVTEIDTGLMPHNLLRSLLEIEADMGRVRKEKWESRIIDLDILIYGNEIINDENLKIPHPYMHERRFVMSPISELAPDLIHPVIGKTMIELFNSINGDINNS
ncbi:2-amino-4-hydroxy-6-hydroxymethyldihydropteridine diphosphokinase, partial [Thermodesulfobacteriota bacterium]